MAQPRPILPRAGGDRPPPAFTPPPKRQQTAVACEQCRKRKIKCDGSRPSCTNCSRKSLPCEYAADPGAGRARGSAARQEVLEKENAGWRALFDYVRVRPESEAMSIFHRLRQSQDIDPADVLQMVQTGEVLAQLQQPQLSRGEPVGQQTVGASGIQLGAQPWTSVADDGIVSELISLFFEWEASFEFPTIDTDAFLADMRSGDIHSANCSPMLVNAICAMSCFLSDKIQELDGIQRGGFAARFFEAARQDFERNSKPSLMSVQGLYLMFMYGVAKGEDKKYAQYRFTACSMIQTLNLERKYVAATEGRHSQAGSVPAQIDRKELKSRIISRGTWGLFCTETIIAFAYGQPSLISPPKIAPPSQEPLLLAQCEISKSLHDIMQYSRLVISGIGDPSDVEKRASLYNDLTAIRLDQSLSESQISQHGTTTLHYLTELYHISAITLLRPLLSCDAVISMAGIDLKKACIDHCEHLAGGWRRLEKSNELTVTALWQVLTPATCGFTLVAQLGKTPDGRVRELFVACCAMLRQQTGRWPLAVYWLQALQYFARTINAMPQISDEARQYLEGLDNLGIDITGEVSIGFLVPMQEELVDMASDSDAPEVSIGKLIEKFNASLAI